MCYGPAMQNRRLRRALTGIFFILGMGGLLVVKSLAPARAAAPSSSVSPADALKLLLEGNQRFVEGTPERPNQTVARREALVGGQQPFAAILSCSDSRTTPEIVFDRGKGDLFVEVRVQTPGKLNKRQRELLQELEGLTKVENRPQRRTLMGKVKDIFG